MADILGLALIPWQRYLIALLADPLTATLVVQVGRQQGKTLVLLVWLMWRCLSHPREAAIYSMQDAAEAYAKLKAELLPLLEDAKLDPENGQTFNRRPGAEFGPQLDNGARIRVLASGKHKGRGETRVGAANVDESSTDIDDNRLVLITPMQTVISDAQMTISGTAGDATSIMFERQIRQAVEAAKAGDRDVKVAYWGLSVPGDPVPEHDPGDENLWRQVLPGLGYVCEPPAIRSARRRLEEWQFGAEYLGVWLRTRTDQCFPAAVWRRTKTDDPVDLDGRLHVAVDCHPTADRPAAAVCDENGIVAMASGCDTLADVVPWLRDICSRRHVVSVSVPAKGVLEGDVDEVEDDLEDEGTELVRVDGAGVARASHGWWQAMHADPRRAAMRPSAEFDEANDTSFRHETNNVWYFRRRDDSGWASPLTAAALAWFAADGDDDDGETLEELRERIRAELAAEKA